MLPRGHPSVQTPRPHTALLLPPLPCRVRLACAARFSLLPIKRAHSVLVGPHANRARHKLPHRPPLLVLPLRAPSQRRSLLSPAHRAHPPLLAGPLASTHIGCAAHTYWCRWCCRRTPQVVPSRAKGTHECGPWWWCSHAATRRRLPPQGRNQPASGPSPML